MVKIFWRISIITPKRFDPERQNDIGMINDIGIWNDDMLCLSVFLGAGNPCPKGAGRQRPKNFGTPTYAQTVWHRATKFGVVTHVGMGVFFSQGGGALASQTFWGFPTCAHLLWETTTKFCAVIKLHVTKNFARSARNADGRSVSGIANLLDDLSTLSIFTLSLYLFISCLPFASNSTPQSDNTSQRSSKL